AAAATAPAAALLPFRAAILVVFVEFVLFGQIVVIVGLDRNRFELGRRGGTRAAARDAHLGAFLFAFGHALDGDAVKLLDRAQILALGIEEVNRRLGRGIERDDRSLALGRFVLDQTQRGKPGAGSRADQPQIGRAHV